MTKPPLLRRHPAPRPKPKPEPALPAELILTYSPGMLAEALGVSKSQIVQLHRQKKLPLPVTLSDRTPRYVVAEIRAWLAAGAPPRPIWEARKANAAGQASKRAS